MDKELSKTSAKNSSPSSESLRKRHLQWLGLILRMYPDRIPKVALRSSFKVGLKGK